MKNIMNGLKLGTQNLNLKQPKKCSHRFFLKKEKTFKMQFAPFPLFFERNKLPWRGKKKLFLREKTERTLALIRIREINKKNLLASAVLTTVFVPCVFLFVEKEN